jgi:hypothetical protein
MYEEETSRLLSETENLMVWRNKEDQGYLYHLELGHLTLHLMSEEWEELVGLILSATSE